jgi:hypothetical protein
VSVECRDDDSIDRGALDEAVIEAPAAPVWIGEHPAAGDASRKVGAPRPGRFHLSGPTEGRPHSQDGTAGGRILADVEAVQSGCRCNDCDAEVADGGTGVVSDPQRVESARDGNRVANESLPSPPKPLAS